MIAPHVTNSGHGSFYQSCVFFLHGIPNHAWLQHLMLQEPSRLWTLPSSFPFETWANPPRFTYLHSFHPISFPRQPQFSSPKQWNKRGTEGHHINLQGFFGRGHHCCIITVFMYVDLSQSILYWRSLRWLLQAMTGFDFSWSSQLYLSQDPGIQDKRHGMVSLLDELCKIKTVLEVPPKKVKAREGLSPRNTQQFYTTWEEFSPSTCGRWRLRMAWCRGRGSWKWIHHRNRNLQSLTGKVSKISPSPNFLPSLGFGPARFSYKWCVSWNIQKTRWWCVQAKPSQPLGIGISASLFVSGDFFFGAYPIASLGSLSNNNCPSASPRNRTLRHYYHLLVASFVYLVTTSGTSRGLFVASADGLSGFPSPAQHLHPDTQVALGKWSSEAYCNRCHLAW